ncbi:MAG: mycofactocin biosynthesis peptidyl-dipeptidase MftE [Actinomycetota bacterium]|nr:mycofactocin biosynthesis peptidyl-dipeptidase MftE [Actinomycetota bacterium]
MPWLADLAWPDVLTRAEADALLAIPLGSTEQHGPHLPLSTDSDIAVALCERLDAAHPDVLVAPAVSYGSSGEHAGFPGTLSIGQPAVELLVLELGRSAFDTFRHVLFVSAHGGNAEPVTRAVERLRAESRDVAVFMPRWDGDPHAGRTETSLLLALRPDSVRTDRIVPGNVRPLSELAPLVRQGGLRAVTENGILGDPSGANADEGDALLDKLAAELVDVVTEWRAA